MGCLAPGGVARNRIYVVEDGFGNAVVLPFVPSQSRTLGEGSGSAMYLPSMPGKPVLQHVRWRLAFADKRQAVYDKPILSHELGILSTYLDFSLRERYVH